MLPDERVNDTERLTRTRCTQNNRTTERIDDIDPSFYNPQIQFSAKSETKRLKKELQSKTKRSKKDKRTATKMQPKLAAFLV